jgi:hypothetical protein
METTLNCQSGSSSQITMAAISDMVTDQNTVWRKFRIGNEKSNSRQRFMGTPDRQIERIWRA